MLANIQALRTTGSEFVPMNERFAENTQRGRCSVCVGTFPLLTLLPRCKFGRRRSVPSVDRNVASTQEICLLCARCIELRTLAFKQSRLGELS